MKDAKVQRESVCVCERERERGREGKYFLRYPDRQKRQHGSSNLYHRSFFCKTYSKQKGTKCFTRNNPSSFFCRNFVQLIARQKT